MSWCYIMSEPCTWIHGSGFEITVEPLLQKRKGSLQHCGFLPVGEILQNTRSAHMVQQRDCCVVCTYVREVGRRKGVCI